MRLVTLLLLLCPTLFTSLPARAVVVVAADIPPYVIRSQQGAPSGMAIEVLEEAARRLGETLEIELMPLARALSQTRHRPDVLLLPPARNPQRESQFLWIAPLLEEAFVLVSHRNHHPAPLTVADLPGLTVGAMRGSHGQSLIPLLEGVTQELVSEEINNASKLARGRIQGWPSPGIPPATTSSGPVCPSRIWCGARPCSGAPSTWPPVPASLRARRCAGAGSSRKCDRMVASLASFSSTIIRHPELPKPPRMVMVSP